MLASAVRCLHSLTRWNLIKRASERFFTLVVSLREEYMINPRPVDRLWDRLLNRNDTVG